MNEPLLARLIDATHRTIAGRAAELDALDEAIGDGDHGTNLARGLAAVAAQRDELACQPLGTALAGIGAILERETGGVGGTCYGALLTGMSRAAPSSTPGLVELVAMLRAGVAAVQAKGRASKGEKTLLDVLIPVAQAAENLVAEGRPEQLGGRMMAAAAHGLHATTHMEAKHGLAADLGVASVNRLDPGACSCALLIGAVVGALESEQKAA
jgi:dihydroxyacetone kinase-like protein